MEGETIDGGRNLFRWRVKQTMEEEMNDGGKIKDEASNTTEGATNK